MKEQEKAQPELAIVRAIEKEGDALVKGLFSVVATATASPAKTVVTKPSVKSTYLTFGLGTVSRRLTDAIENREWQVSTDKFNKKRIVKLVSEGRNEKLTAFFNEQALDHLNDTSAKFLIWSLCQPVTREKKEVIDGDKSIETEVFCIRYRLKELQEAFGCSHAMAYKIADDGTTALRGLSIEAYETSLGKVDNGFTKFSVFPFAEYKKGVVWLELSPEFVLRLSKYAPLRLPKRIFRLGRKFRLAFRLYFEFAKHIKSTVLDKDATENEKRAKYTLTIAHLIEVFKLPKPEDINYKYKEKYIEPIVSGMDGTGFTWWLVTENKSRLVRRKNKSQDNYLSQNWDDFKRMKIEVLPDPETEDLPFPDPENRPPLEENP